jgi:hypothetical protein
VRITRECCVLITRVTCLLKDTLCFVQYTPESLSARGNVHVLKCTWAENTISVPQHVTNTLEGSQARPVSIHLALLGWLIYNS